MNFDFIRSATSKELEQFKSVCNQLLSRTYIVRTLFRPGKGRVNNPDYTFLSLHYEAVQEYLRQHRTIAEASAVESPIRQETIGFPAHFFARAHNFKPPGRACQPEADSPMRT